MNAYQLGAGITVLSATPDPVDKRRVVLSTTTFDPAAAIQINVEGVTNLAGHLIAAGSSSALNTRRVVLADAGEFTSGFQDEFSSLSLEPGWVPAGPASNVYSSAAGVLHIGSAAGDPNHLLYQGAAYDPGQQEIVGRIRVQSFGAGDGPRGGLATGVSSSISQGFDFHFRNDGALGYHLAMLDDFRTWGPTLDLDWGTNLWYWMRLRYQPNPTRGEPDLLAKIWPADTTTPEPIGWLAWDRFSSLPDRYGYAGLAAGSAGGLAELDVDYLLIKAEGLPTIRVSPLSVPLPPLLNAVGFGSAGEFKMRLAGRAGENYRVERSADLLDWKTLQEGVCPADAFEVTDPGQALTTQQFYRATIP